MPSPYSLFLIMLVEGGEGRILHYHSGAIPISQTPANHFIYVAFLCSSTQHIEKDRIIILFLQKETEAQFHNLRESGQIQRIKIQVSSHFSTVTLKDRGQWRDTFKLQQEKYFLFRLCTKPNYESSQSKNKDIFKQESFQTKQNKTPFLRRQ